MKTLLWPEMPITYTMALQRYDTLGRTCLRKSLGAAARAEKEQRTFSTTVFRCINWNIVTWAWRNRIAHLMKRTANVIVRQWLISGLR